MLQSLRDGTFQLSGRRENYIRRQRFKDLDSLGKAHSKGSDHAKQESSENDSYYNQNKRKQNKISPFPAKLSTALVGSVS